LDFDLYGGLSPMDFRPFRCSDISVVTQDTCIYCFNLATPNSSLNLPVSSYVLARAEVNGETVIRPYTPISNFIGELPILVKTYPHAKMGRRFAALEVGDTMYFKGPFQTFVYEENAYDRLTLVAGGTGVTPMLQLIDKVLTNPLDRTKMHLILCNKDEFNMPLAAELNEFAETYPNRLRVTHLIDKPLTEEWDGLTGHISKELLLVSCGKPHPHHKVFVSGPPGFMKHVCGLKGEDYTQGPIGGLLSELGFTERDVFKF
jgi:cytochrome-b5 reductase